MRKSSTADLDPLDKETRPAVIVSLKQPISHQNNSIEVFVHYGHNRRIYNNLQVQQRTEAFARKLGLL